MTKVNRIVRGSGSIYWAFSILLIITLISASIPPLALGTQSYGDQNDPSTITNNSQIFRKVDPQNSIQEFISGTLEPVEVGTEMGSIEPKVIAVDDSYSMDRNGTLEIKSPGVLENDKNAAKLTVVGVEKPANGLLQLKPDGSFIYTLVNKWAQADIFSYTIDTGTGFSNEAIVKIVIEQTNQCPVAVADKYTVDEGGILRVSESGVLANDGDADSDTLSAIKVNGPSHGTLDFHPTGTFLYSHSGDESTTDSFTYRLNDVRDYSGIAKVQITIKPVNDLPVGVDDLYSVEKGRMLTINSPGILANDTDVDSDTLTVEKTSGPSHGTLKLNADGSFTYTASNSAAKSDSFTYKISDGKATSETTLVTIGIKQRNSSIPDLSPISILDFDNSSHKEVQNVFADRVSVAKSGSNGIEVSFPKGAIDEDGIVIITEKEPRCSTGAEVMKAFELQAFTIKTGTEISGQETGGTLVQIPNSGTAIITEISQFNKDLTISIIHEPGELHGIDTRSLKLYYLDEETGHWIPIQNSEYNPKTSVLTATVDHFTEFTEQANPVISGPGRVTAAQVGLHSGAAIYSYPIEVPPGRNGFQPNLALTYSSAQVNEMKNKRDVGSWAGIGWSLNMGRISYDPLSEKQYLETNDGISYELIEAGDAAYQTIPESFYQITKSDTQEWEMLDREGNYYRFGGTDDSEQYYFGELAEGGTGTVYYRWDLSEMEQNTTLNNEPGSGHNNITISYIQSKCNDGDDIRSAYPGNISYNNDNVDITFNLHGTGTGCVYRIDNPSDPQPTIMDNRELDSIEIREDGNMVREYVLDTKYTNVIESDDYGDIEYAGTHKLISIQEFGSDGQSSLPKMEFEYETKPFHIWDSKGFMYQGNPGNPGILSWPFLVKIKNGYGGTTTFSYEEKPQYPVKDIWTRQIVTQQTIDPGDPGQVMSYQYSYSGTPQYNPNNSSTAQDDEYRGFEMVTKTDSDGNYTDHHFHTTGSLREEYLSGKEYRTEWRNSGNSLLKKAEYDWNYSFPQNNYYESLWSAQVVNAVDMDLDTNGNVYVLDCGGAGATVHKFNSFLEDICSWGGNFTGAGQLSNPGGIAVTDSGSYVYVADTGNHRILKFTSCGTQVAEWGSFGTGNGQFGTPMGVAVDANGYVYVADTGNDRIQKLSSSGAYQGEWGGSGTSSGSLSSPVDVEVGSDGYVYVVDQGNSRIAIFDSSYHSQQTGFTTPQRIAMDGYDNYFVVDTGANELKQFTSSGNETIELFSSGSGTINCIGIGTNGERYDGYSQGLENNSWELSYKNENDWEYFRTLMTGTSDNDVFASISCEIEEDVYLNQVQYFDGAKWNVLPYPEVDQAFIDIWSFSSSSLFAALQESGTIMHYDGFDWNQEYVIPDYCDNSQFSEAIWGASGTLFVTGECRTCRSDEPLWDCSGVVTEGHDVWGTSDTDVYVVGVNAGSPALYHYDGNQWSIRALLPNYAFLPISIWGTSGTNIYTMNELDEYGNAVYLYHFDGSQWYQKSYFLDEPYFMGIWGTSNSNIWAFASNESVFRESKVKHFDGDTWTDVSITESISSQGISSMWVSEDDVFVGTMYGNIYRLSKGTVKMINRSPFVYLEEVKTTDGSGAGARTSQISYTYDNYGNVVTENHNNEFSISREFNPNEDDNILSLPASETILRGGTASHTVYYYDESTNSSSSPIAGNLTKLEEYVSSGQSISTSYDYDDDYGNMISVIDPNGKETSFTYDSTNHVFPVSKSLPCVTGGCFAESYDHDYGTGNLKYKVNINGGTTTYEYDTFGRLTKIIRPGDTEQSPSIQYMYNKWGTPCQQNLETTTKADGGNYLRSQDYFDGLGRVIQTHASTNSGSITIASTSEYNNRGFVAKEYVSQLIDRSGIGNYHTPDTSGEDAWRYTSYSYDAIGRVESQTSPDYSTVSRDYTTPWEETVTNQRGKKKTYEFDAFGRLIQVEELNSDGTGVYGTTEYKYDVLGNLIEVEDTLGGTTTMNYDWISRKTDMNDPDMGGWSYQYDANGNLTNQTDAKNQTITFAYDSLNRNTGKSYPAGSGMSNITYSYDDTSDGNFGRGLRTGMIDAMATIEVPDGPSIVYVDASNTGTKNGLSWASAYTNLQNALDGAEANSEIWVSSGTYTPTRSGSTPARTDTFMLKDGVGIYGGFSGVETSRNQRDWVSNVTTLSGEILNPGIADNCYHVVTGNGVSDSTVLDGFVIRDGRTAMTTPGTDDDGAGMLNIASSPLIRNCIFTNNVAARRGGGMFCSSSSAPVVENCVFRDNESENYRGGGLFGTASPVRVTNCEFYNNSARDGGAICDSKDPSLLITNCTTYENSATNGGGIYISCNSSYDCTTDLANCTFYENSANNGGAVYGKNVDTNPIITSCILWGNSSLCGEICNVDGATATLSYCDIQDGYSGTGNITGTPMFTNPGSGDFHLSGSSPCINNGSNSAIPDSITTDFEGEYRILSNTIDMGIDEFGPSTYTLSVSMTSGGSATTPNEGNHSYSIGTAVSLIAQANQGYEFAYWSGDVSTIIDTKSSSTTIIVNGTCSITANFISSGTQNGTFYKYDELGRMVQETRVVDGINYLTQFTSDSADRLISTTYPDGEVITQDYDYRGLPYSLDGSVVGDLVTQRLYNQLGQIKRIDLGNGTFSEYQYWGIDHTDSGTDQYSKLWEIKTKSNGEVLQQVQHTWGSTGNLLIRTDALASQTEIFGYDFLDRIDYASGPYTAKTWEYNQIGNITEMNGMTYNYGTKPHAVTSVGTATYTYDANGNMTSRGSNGQTIVWNVENMPVAIGDGSGTSTFVYDGDGSRVLKTENGQTILYVNKYFEKNLTTGEETCYYYLGGKRIAYKKDGEIEYTHNDHLGSTSVTTDSDGDDLATVKYFPFGGARPDSDAPNTAKLFTGQRLDQTGLYFYNARYYDATIGRFISADTIVPDIYNPQAWNRYSYCLNNPLKYVDPSGHDVEYDGVNYTDEQIQWMHDMALMFGAGQEPTPSYGSGGSSPPDPTNEIVDDHRGHWTGDAYIEGGETYLGGGFLRVNPETDGRAELLWAETGTNFSDGDWSAFYNLHALKVSAPLGDSDASIEASVLSSKGHIDVDALSACASVSLARADIKYKDMGIGINAGLGAGYNLRDASFEVGPLAVDCPDWVCPVNWL